MSAHQTQYPAGALVRVKQICGDPESGLGGLLPINPSTWYEWVKEGRAPQGTLIGKNTRVWQIETVLAIGKGEGATA